MTDSNGRMGSYTTSTSQFESIVDSGLTPGTSPICPNGTNGALTTTGCSGGGGGGTPGGSLYSLQYNNTTFAGTSPVPATNGQYTIEYLVIANAAVAPTPVQNGLGGRPITGASSTDLVAYSDNGTVIDHDIGCTSSVTETLPTATTLGNPNFVYIYTNHCPGFTDTIQPSTWTIQQGTNAAASTLSVPPGNYVRIKVDPNSATNWLADLVNPSSAVTITGSPANGNLAKFSSASSLTNGDLSGDCSTSGTLAVTCTKANGGSFPASATVLGTNGSSQPVAATTTGSGTTAVLATSPTLVTPVLGAATATSLLASGIVDGEAPVTVTTGASATLGGTYNSGYTFNGLRLYHTRWSS